MTVFLRELQRSFYKRNQRKNVRQMLKKNRKEKMLRFTTLHNIQISENPGKAFKYRCDGKRREGGKGVERRVGVERREGSREESGEEI